MWDLIENHWTVAIFMPAILIVITILAVITHRWDSGEWPWRRGDQDTPDRTGPATPGPYESNSSRPSPGDVGVGVGPH